MVSASISSKIKTALQIEEQAGALTLIRTWYMQTQHVPC